MKCSIVGGKCQHNIGKKDKFIFVIMPFKDEFNNVYDAIETTINEMGGYEYERADVEYTKDAIWCKRICRNILRAQYVIADITGNNPNVFYELGFVQAIDDTNPIIITQNVKDVPFDIAPINLIEYNLKNLKELRLKIKNAIETIANEVLIVTNRTPEETIAELRKQLIDEEKRSKGFKDELKESEEKEKKLKEIIKEHEAIKADPEKQFKGKIIELEKEIAEYKAKLKLSEQEIEQVQTQWELELKEKEEKLKIFEDELNEYKQDRNIEKIENILFKDNEEKLDAINYFNLAYEEKNIDKQILFYTKAIELDSKFFEAYINRGVAFYDKGDSEKAISDYNKAIEFEHNDAIIYFNRGLAYGKKRDFDKAISDYNKAIELDNSFTLTYNNLKELYIITNKYDSSLKITLNQFESPKDEIVYYLLEFITKIMLGKECNYEYEKIMMLAESKIKLNWSFVQLEEWLDSLPGSDSKNKIVELIEIVKNSCK
jgi:tetratricopeptide (TPR) repeat protein